MWFSELCIRRPVFATVLSLIVMLVGLVSVELKPAPEAAVKAMLNRLRYFGHGASWGGFESLVTYPKPERVRSATRWQSGPVLRLHIGLEDPSDLIADLEAAFKVLHDAA